MIEVASCVGTVKYIRRGISAISYEIALDTNSVTADGNTGKFLTTKLGKYHFLKHTGNKTEDCTDVLETFNFLVLPIDKNGSVLINGRISGGASGDIYDPLLNTLIEIAGEHQWIKGKGKLANLLLLMDSIGRQSTAWKGSLIKALKRSESERSQS